MLIDIAISSAKKSTSIYLKGGQTWCIQQLYIKCLPKYHTGNFKKAIISLISNNETEDKVENMVDVISITKVFDFEKYSQLSEKYDKKKMLLDVLQAGMITLAKHGGWSIDPLIDAYDCCLAKNLEHKWLRKGKYFLSPDRKYYAGVFCNWDIGTFEAFAIFLNKQKEEISKIKLFEREPWDVDPMGKMGWDKETGEFYMYSKDERHKWTAIPSSLS